MKKKKLATRQKQMMLLKELPIDFDWDGAAKRSGITKEQLFFLKKDKAFMARASDIMDTATEEMVDAKNAVEKFKTTQKLLSEELHDGNMTVASSVLKCHEMEFKMHGLFEKDNNQKGEALVMNITMHAPVQPVKEIEGDVIDA